MAEQVPVLIVGGGPVGLMLGLELGSRGVPALVIDESLATPVPRANLIAARSMEYFRRLGFADEVRAAGLPADYPHDTAYRTTFTGEELYRVPVPSAAAVRDGAVSEADWPTPEPQHRINQMYVEQILAEQVQRFPSLTVERGVRLLSLEQGDGLVRAEVEEVETGARRTIEAQWLVGCDGTRSTVRRQVGLRYVGVDKILQVVSVYFRSRELLGLGERPAWMTFTFNPHHVGAVTAIDGEELWVSHHHFPPTVDPSQFEPRELLEQTLGRSIDFETVAVIPWRAKAMVAEHYRSERVFLAGDAAHDWVPAAGFGMNAGLGDAVDLGWKLAAVLNGWGGDGLLDAYEAERRSLGDTVSRALGAVGGSLFTLEPRMRVDEPGEAGERAREELREGIPMAENGFHHAVGLNFGFQYSSPIVVSDGSEPAQFSIAAYDPDGRPGRRLPHLRLADGTPLFDHLGPELTLLRIGADAPVAAALLEAAAVRGVPLIELLVPDASEARALFGARLLLVRPDQHIAWRGDELPADALALIDQVRGAGGG
ncbi:MAG TPA: FAD-dependent monooxygenase [Conexibacter sp.]|jgi:2-polyprenyl-6-methoxyphenol hydroxylase-like FAD-dependent oxidoreductase